MKSEVFAGRGFTFAQYADIRSGESEPFLNMTSSLLSAISFLTAWSGTRMIPEPSRAIRMSTALLLDDSDPFTSTSRGRGEFRNGQLLGPEYRSARQLCCPKILRRLRSAELSEIFGRTADHMPDRTEIVRDNAGKRWLLTADDDVKSVFRRNEVFGNDREMDPDTWVFPYEFGGQRGENESRV